MVCKYCNKNFSSPKNRWRHEKLNCSIKKMNDFNNTKNNNKKQNDINKNNVKGPVIKFNKLGNEQLDILSENDINIIFNSEIEECIIEFIRIINFNKQHPENHTLCNSNLNNKFISVLNTDNLKIEKKPEYDVYEKILTIMIERIKQLKGMIINDTDQNIFVERFQEFENNMSTKPKYKKAMFDRIRGLGYTERHMIKNTWSNNNIII